MEPFIRKRAADGTETLELAAWMERYPGLTAGFSTRRGGVSREPCGTLNCGLHVEDDPRSVVENRKRLAEAVGLPLENWTYGEQVHGSDVQLVTASDKGRGTTSRDSAFAAKDAFITRQTDLCLAGLFADCVPILFYDPQQQAVGLAHAGWRGTVAQVAGKTVSAMSREFGTKPERLLAAIGPSIRSCCYEVDRTVIERVDEALDGKAAAGTLEGVKPYRQVREGAYRLDLQEVNRQIMIKAGILPANIELSQLCTGCNTELFFSHRRENGRTGRMAAWIGLKSVK